MRLILTDNEGTVLDTTEFPRGEWDDAQSRPIAAWGILSELNAGDAK